ncbi:UNVERIFIED_ORG: hypothetical protein LHK14_12385 [Roseateles sp. XES5]|nr:hypothetical protein [Roseateles sp. XES5]
MASEADGIQSSFGHGFIPVERITMQVTAGRPVVFQWPVYVVRMMP